MMEDNLRSTGLLQVEIELIKAKKKRCDEVLNMAAQRAIILVIVGQRKIYVLAVLA